MTKRFLALTVALLLAFCFASCKKADKDKTEVSSTDGTSSYEFILEDDLDESLSPEEEKEAQDAWNSVVKDSSNAIEFEPYNPSTSSKETTTSSKGSGTSSSSKVSPSSSSSKPTSPSSSSSTPESSSSSATESTTSKPGWRPGTY